MTTKITCHTILIGEMELNVYHEVTGEVNDQTKVLDDPFVPSAASSARSSETLNNLTSTPSTTDNSAEKQTIFVVLQHSSSAGNSALLPVSSVVCVHTSRDDALRHLQSLKTIHRPIIRKEEDNVKDGLNGQVKFWCTGDGPVSGDGGYRYVDQGGEEFVVWIEEHELKK